MSGNRAKNFTDISFHITDEQLEVEPQHAAGSCSIINKNKKSDFHQIS
jgi:hypothetical protein